MKFLFLILLFTVGACVDKESNKIKVQKMYQEIKNDFNEMPEFKLSDLKKLSSDIQLVDVRAEKEIAISMIPGAISKEDFEKKLDRFKNKKIVVYCTIGYRSAKYVKKLMAKKINAYNLEGSLLGWLHAGGKVNNANNKETKKVHVYGKSWDHLPEGYTAVW